MLFFKGFLIGLVMAAPVGPVGILSLKRTFSAGHLCGLVSGLGISTADAVYGLLAAFGLSAVSSFLLAQQVWLHILGGLVLCGLGVRTYFTAGRVLSSSLSSAGSYCGAYLSALALTLLNPVLIVSFAALFAGADLVGPDTDRPAAITIVCGVFCGSAIWWVLLSGAVSRLRLKFSDALIVRINHFTGVLLFCCGIVVLGSKMFI